MSVEDGYVRWLGEQPNLRFTPSCYLLDDCGCVSLPLDLLEDSDDGGTGVFSVSGRVCGSYTVMLVVDPFGGMSPVSLVP